MGITKTDFMRGMQCRKMLWLDKHKPDLRVIPPYIQEKLDTGNEFGDRAMAMFGEYEEMTIYRPGTQIPDKKAMAARTAEHLEKGTPVIETLSNPQQSWGESCTQVAITKATEKNSVVYYVRV